MGIMSGMAGRPSSKTGALISRHLCNAFRKDVGVSLEFLGQALIPVTEGMVGLAVGVYYEDVDKEGARRVYKTLPDFRAANYILNRFYGVPRTEESVSEERLRSAQAELLEAQIKADLPEAQARETLSRAAMKEIEAEMWPKQFVTEDKELKRIQRIASAVNRPLLMLTSDELAQICPGVEDPATSLERLKDRIGRDQAEIVQEVMEYEDDEDTDEE